jgi:hypothetical protein
MKKILLILTLTAITSVAFSQTKCGTMQLLEDMKEKDPTLEKKMEENEQKNQEWLKKNIPTRDKSDYSFPLVPGFVPTGYFDTDYVNFQFAKQILYDKDPQAYRFVTSFPNQNEEELQAERKEKLKKQNNKFKK